MKKRMAILLAAATMMGTLAIPRLAAADDQTVSTAGAGGVYPSGTSFIGIQVNGLQLAFGAEVNSDQTGLGNFTVVLLGVTALGLPQNIVVEGAVTGGIPAAGNVAVLAGTTSVDLGDGTPPIPALPFTATLTRDAATHRGTVGLVIGNTTLPSATLNAGSLTVETVTTP
jgi:hypothetical protein